MNEPFLAQIPSDARKFGETDSLSEHYAWFETIQVDGVPFRCSITASENRWSGFREPSDPKEREGTKFAISCLEQGDQWVSCESELKSRRMRSITNRKGFSRFRMSLLKGDGNTLQEARDKFTEHCYWFLRSKKTTATTEK